ncbi:MAG: ATP synthase subunit C [Candidatus Limivivens sp.]|nr:ATP synthase subunit C [Candidatus Limivivens sp.]
MSTTITIVSVIALILTIIVPFGIYLVGERNRGRFKTSLAINVFLFFGTLMISSIVAFTDKSAALAAETAAANAGDLSRGMGFIAAAVVTGLSCIGGGVAVASAASAALGAISEDGSVFGKSMIFVAMAEGIALYGLIISFMILGKI